MVAGLRLFGVYRREHSTGGVSRFDDLAVLAVQVVFESVFDAVLTDHGVGRIVQQRVFLILLLRHKAGVAEDVRGVLRAVLTAVCALDLDADELVFHDRRDELHARVLDENIVGSIDGVADIYRVTYTGNDAHLLGGVAVVDIISRAHIAHQLDRRGVRVYLLTDIVRVKHRALDSRHVRVVLERRGHGYGQVVGIFVAVALYHVYKLKDDRVRVVVCEEFIRVYLQVIGLLIADEGTAVAVIDIAARSGNYTLSIRKLAAAVVVCLALYDLELIKRHQIHRQEQQDEDNKPRNSARFYKSVVHCKSFPLLDPLCRREVRHRRKRQRPERLDNDRREHRPAPCIARQGLEHLEHRRDEQRRKRDAHEGKEAPVYKELGHERRRKRQRRQNQREENRMLHKGHISEYAHDERKQRAERRALEHPDRHGDRRQHHRARAEQPEMAEDHVLRHQRQEHEQRVSQHAVYIYLFKKILQLLFHHFKALDNEHLHE